MKLTPLLCAATALLALTACAGSDDEDDKDLKNGNLPICPQVAIIHDIDSFSDYGQEKASPDQLVTAAKLKGVEGTCEYKKDGIDVAFELRMTALRGPRLGGLHASLPFFVAVVDPQSNILNKERLTAEIGFSSSEKTANHAEALHVFIPLEKAKRASGPNYQVLIGFQLTEAQFKELNKKAAP